MSIKSLADLPIRKVNETRLKFNFLVYGDSGVGKGHPHGTMILTPNGWSKIEELELGNEVVSGTGKICRITGLHHRGMLNTYRVIFNDGTSLVVDDDHLWVTRSLNDQAIGNPWKVLETSFIRGTLHRMWRIPIVPAIQFPKRNVVIDPYVLGVLLGDGHLLGTTPTISTDIKTAELLRNLLPTSTIMKQIPQEDRSPSWSLHSDWKGNILTHYIRSIGLNVHSYDKFIPDDYLFNDVNSRISILQGLMDTDGELNKREGNGSNISYSTASSRLADDVEFLVQSLGGIVRRTIRTTPKYKYKGEIRTGRPSYRLCICLPDEIQPFRSRSGYNTRVKYYPNRIIKDIIPEGIQEVICLSVDSPSETYVAESCIVTHNTRLAGSAFDVPELCPLLMLNAEGGELTLRSTYPEIDSIRITSWTEVQNLCEALGRGNHGYRTIIVDSLTEIQKLGMNYVMNTRHSGNDLAVPEIKEWNINIEQTRGFVRTLRDLDSINTIFTALVRVDTDKRTGLSRKKPLLSGKVADEVAAFLDVVTYYYVEEHNGENLRILLTGNTPSTVAKDRSDALPLQIANPTMALIYKYISEKEYSSDI